MSATARAEARRKAILSRGTDRLAKLTTSARGEDHPVYSHDGGYSFNELSLNLNLKQIIDPPLPSLSNFVGEESDMPARSASSTSPRPSTRGASSNFTSPFEAAGLGTGPTPDPSVWSQEQQQQFLAALMGGGPLPGQSQSRLPPPSVSNGSGAPPQPPPLDPNNPLAAMLASFPPSLDGSGAPPLDPNNPFAAMMASFPPQGAFPQPGSGKLPAGPTPPTRLQKVMPFIHLVTIWSLLGYFVLWKEPQVYEMQGGGHGVVGEGVDGIWSRWAELGRRNAASVGGAWMVQVVVRSIFIAVMLFECLYWIAQPFFWAFTTLQIVLHSLQIFSGFVRTDRIIALDSLLIHTAGRRTAADAAVASPTSPSTTISIHNHKWSQVPPDGRGFP